jgi:peptide deformylase
MTKTRIWTLWADGKINEADMKVLRSISEEVPVPFNAETKEIIRKLTEAFLERDDALGLAAPQIGFSKRIVAFKVRNLNERKKIRGPEDYEVLVNPRITQTRGDEETMPEGCLSCPDINVDVNRRTEIKVRAFDAQGNKINKRYSGFLARIVQHEIDHLEGKLIVDSDGAVYIPKTKRAFFEQIFKRDFSEAEEP